MILMAHALAHEQRYYKKLSFRMDSVEFKVQLSPFAVDAKKKMVV